MDESEGVRAMDLISMAVGAAIGMVLVVIAVLIIVAMKKPEDISWLKEIWQKQLDQNERKINIMQSIDYGVQGLISVLKSEKTDPYEAFQNWMLNHGFSDVANWKPDEFDSERLGAAVDSYYKMKIGGKPF
jgi:hypothetical protein